MTAIEKYNKLDDELKTVPISGVLQGVPLTVEQHNRLIRQLREWGPYDLIEIPAVDLQNE